MLGLQLGWDLGLTVFVVKSPTRKAISRLELELGLKMGSGLGQGVMYRTWMPRWKPLPYTSHFAAAALTGSVLFWAASSVFVMVEAVFGAVGSLLIMLWHPNLAHCGEMNDCNWHNSTVAAVSLHCLVHTASETDEVERLSRGRLSWRAALC